MKLPKAIDPTVNILWCGDGSRGNITPMTDRATPTPAAPAGITRQTARLPSSAPVTAPDSVARQAKRNRTRPGSDARSSRHAWVNEDKARCGIANPAPRRAIFALHCFVNTSCFVTRPISTISASVQGYIAQTQHHDVASFLIDIIPNTFVGAFAEG